MKPTTPPKKKTVQKKKPLFGKDNFLGKFISKAKQRAIYAHYEARYLCVRRNRIETIVKYALRIGANTNGYHDPSTKSMTTADYANTAKILREIATVIEKGPSSFLKTRYPDLRAVIKDKLIARNGDEAKILANIKTNLPNVR